jgi:hypothetical protein
MNTHEQNVRRLAGKRIEFLEKKLQRLTDLVRHQRQELYQAGLITDQEYSDLVMFPGSVDRLGSYDDMKAALKEIADTTHEKDTREFALKALGLPLNTPTTAREGL